MATQSSDYDTNAIVLHPKRNYLLQNFTKAIHLKAKLDDGTEVDCHVIDVLRANQYILETNHKIYETFSGLQIYTTLAA